MVGPIGVVGGSPSGPIQSQPLGVFTPAPAQQVASPQCPSPAQSEPIGVVSFPPVQVAPPPPNSVPEGTPAVCSCSCTCQGGGTTPSGATGDVVNASGSTTDSFVTVTGFPVVNAAGMMGIGSILNTGANGLNVRETVIDKFGNTVSVVTPVAAGNEYMLDLQTNFLNVALAMPPYVSYRVEVQSAVAGSPTSYELHFIDLTPGSSGGGGGGGGSESLEQARAIGDTFTGGDVFWDGSRGIVLGKSSSGVNQDYLHIYSDKANNLQVIDSTKDGAGTIRPLSVQMGGTEAWRTLAGGEICVGRTTVVAANGMLNIERDINGQVVIYVRNETDGNNAGSGINVGATDGAGNRNTVSLFSFAPSFAFPVSLAGQVGITGGGIQTADFYLNMRSAVNIKFGTNDIERARFLGTGEFIYGATTLTGTEKFKIVGDTLVDGKLTVTGAIDPTSISLSGTAEGVGVLYVDSADGQNAGLSAANHARIRYNNALTRWEQSVNGGAYSALGGGSGTDTSAWHKTGDSYPGDQKLGNLDAGPNTLSMYNNNQKWVEFSQDNFNGPGALNTPRNNILLGNEFTPESINGGQLQYKRTDTWALLSLICTQDGSAGQGTGESLIGLNNDLSQTVVINMIGSAFAGTTYGVPTASQARIRSTSENFVIGQINKKDLIFFTDNIPFVKFDKDQHVRTLGPVYIGRFNDVTPFVANEYLRVSGGTGIHCDTFIGIGADLTVDPTFTLQIRRDAADINTGIVIDNRNATGVPFFTMGNNPRGTNAALAFSYDNATDNSVIQNTQITACTFTVGNVGNNPLVLKTNNSAAVTIAGSHAVTFDTSITVNTTSTLTGAVAIGGTSFDAYVTVRKDAAGTVNGASLILDNRNATGNPIIYIGNDPLGASTKMSFDYANADNSTRWTHSGVGDLSIIVEQNASMLFKTSNVTALTITGNGGASTVTAAGQYVVGNTSIASNTWTISSTNAVVDGTNKRIGVGVSPSVSFHARNDANDTSGGIVIDARGATSNPVFYMGNNPLGASTKMSIDYDNATNSARFTQSGGALTINVEANATLTFKTNNTSAAVIAADQGITVGAATGGSQGAGTINVATDIFKNASAYANPDYVLEHYYTGKIVRFAKNEGAKKYAGRMTLDEIERHCRETFRLPGIDDRAAGIFGRADLVLEKIEEIYTYLFEMRRDLDKLVKAS